jgi:SynChlorMet cassette protein ScmD
MKRSDKPLANPVVVFREEFDKWGVLFNPDNAQAVGINPVGIMAWRLMDGQHDLNDIVEEVKSSFSDVPDVVSDHVTAFVNDLVERGFVVYELGDENQ